MPDVNLLQNTKQPEDQAPKIRPPVDPHLTNPQPEPKKGLGEALKSLLGHRAEPTIIVAKTSSMAMGRGAAGQRILNDKSGPVKATATLTPLPEDDDFNVNLLTEDVVSTFNLRLRLIQLGLAAVGAALLVGLAYYGLGVYEKSIQTDVKTTQDETLKTQTEIANLEKDLASAKVVTTRLQAFQALVDKHVRWTRFFDRLEHYTLPEVTYGTALAVR